MPNMNILRNRISNTALIVILLMGIGLSLRLININKEFAGDESVLIKITGEKCDQIIPTLKKIEVYPPLTYLSVCYLRTLGIPLDWIRLYFVIFGMGVCFLIYLLAKEYMGDGSAILALSLSIFSPLLIFLSQYARSYIDSAFWMLLSTLAMLRLVKGSDKISNWALYIFSAVLSLYTFYFSIILIFGQCLFVLIFKIKDKKFSIKWFLSVLSVIFLFIPWLPTALSQFSNSSTLSYDISQKGFHFGFLRIGLYARNIFSLAGFDPYFMVFKGGIINHFPKVLLSIFVFLALSAAVFFLYYLIKIQCYKFREKNSLAWFFPFLILAPLLVIWACGIAFNILPFSKYFVVYHGFFLIILAVFIHLLKIKSNFLGNFLLVLILIVYIIRIPEAVSPEFEIRKSLDFLKKNVQKEDGILCVRSSPENYNFKIINAEDCITLNDNHSAFVFKSEADKKALEAKIEPLYKIWLYETGGTGEVFGANDLIKEWLKEQGFKKISVNSFKNITIIKYEK